LLPFVDCGFDEEEVAIEELCGDGGLLWREGLDEGCPAFELELAGSDVCGIELCPVGTLD
jgi:hypothetical protein